MNRHINRNPFLKIIFTISILIFTQSLYGINSPNYEGPEFFVKVKPNIVFNEGENLDSWSSIKQLNKILNDFKVFKIHKAFKISDPKLNQVYKIVTQNKVSNFINSLQVLDIIEYAEVIPLHSIHRTSNDQFFRTDQWNLDKINAQEAWNISKSASTIKIAIVDNAVDYKHPDLISNIWVNPNETINGIDDDNNGYIDDIYGFDVADNDNEPLPPENITYFDHGTHVAGIASASTNNNIGIASIGYNAKIIPIKTTLSNSSNGNLLHATYQGLEYAIASGADIVNMSFGTSVYSATWETLIEVAHDRGIVLVASAGNSNDSTINYPASYKYVISVAGTYSDDEKVYSSTYGSNVDISAPGSGIISTVPLWTGNEYKYSSGTSQAGPLVAGLCALLKATKGDMTPAQIEHCIKSTSDNIDSMNPDYIGKLGAGRINAYSALKCILKDSNSFFSMDKNYLCEGASIKYEPIATDSLTTSYLWKFDGGVPSTSTLRTPQISYPNEGSYDIELITERSGYFDTLKRVRQIKIENASINITGDTIKKGQIAFLNFSMKGLPPFNIIYTDGIRNDTIINHYPFNYKTAVSVNENTNYTILSFSDARCNGVIRNSTTIYVSNDSTCSSGYFANQYSLFGQAPLTVFASQTDSLGNLYISGQVDLPASREPLILKLAPNGRVIWFKSYNFNLGFNLPFVSIKNIANSTDMIVAKPGYGSTAIMRINKNGDIIWSKDYDMVTPNGWGYHSYDLIPSDNNSFILAAVSDLSGNDIETIHLFKVSGTDGSIKWQKRYVAGDLEYEQITSNGKGGVLLSGNNKGALGLAEFSSEGEKIRNVECPDLKNAFKVKTYKDKAIIVSQKNGASNYLITQWDISKPVTEKKWSKEIRTSIDFITNMSINPLDGTIYISYLINDKSNIMILDQEGNVIKSMVSKTEDELFVHSSETGTYLYSFGYDIINLDVLKLNPDLEQESCQLSTSNTQIKNISYGSLEDKPLYLSVLSYDVRTPQVTSQFQEVTPSCLCLTSWVDCLNDTICTSNTPIELTANGGSNYNWLPVNGITFDDPTTPIQNVLPIKNTTFLIEVSNCYCASDTLKKEIFVQSNCDCTPYIPSGFSPNGDGINDYFSPVFTCIPNNYEITIFNRWGEKVFYSNSINSSWDGTQKGKSIPLGSYVYLIKVKFNGQNKESTFKGTVNMISNK